MIRKSGCVALLVAPLLVATACSSSGSNGASDRSGGSGSQSALTVKIGVNESESGDINAVGLPNATGVRLAAKEINGAGGFDVDGKKYKIQLIDVDNRSDGPGSIAAAKKLVVDEKVKFVFGPESSVVALPASQVMFASDALWFDGAGAIQVNGYFKNPKTPHVFGVYQNQTATAETLGKGLVAHGYKTIALIDSDDEATNQNLASVKAGLAAAGMKVVADIRYPADSTDLSSFVTKAKNANPDVVLHATPPARTLEVLKLAAQLKASKALAAWVVSPKALETAHLGLPAFTANSAPSLDFPSTPQISSLAKRVAAFAPSLPLTKDFVFLSYDFVYMLTQAMARAKSVTDVDAISQQLLKMKYEGVAGPICYGDGPDTRNVVAPSYLAADIDGKVTVTSRDRSCSGTKDTVPNAAP